MVCGANPNSNGLPASARICGRRLRTWSRTVEYDKPPAPCSSTNRAKILGAVCRCFLGASKSDRAQLVGKRRHLSWRPAQPQVLTQAAIAVGLHRRLFPEKKRVPSLLPNEVKKLRRAARKAALEEPGVLDRADAVPLTDGDRSDFEQAINDAFSFLNEQTFKSRMQDLVEDAQKSIPTIVANFADWPGSVKPKSRVSQSTVFGAQRALLRTLHD